MKRLLGLVLAAGCAAGPSAAEPAVSGATLRLESAGAHNVFVFEARTGRPDGARFSLRLYYVRRYLVPESLRAPRSWARVGGAYYRGRDGHAVGICDPSTPPYDEELIDAGKDEIRAGGGRLRSELGGGDLPVWPGRYRAVAEWPDPAAPGEDGLARADAEAEVGTVDDLPRMRARADREVYEDMARIGRVLAQLRDRWRHLGPAADAAWADFRRDADRKLDAVKQRNGARRSAEFYWMESSGKQRIEWTLERVCPLMDTAGLFFTKEEKARPDPKELDLALAEAEDDYQHYLDFLCIGRIVDEEKVDAAIRDVRALAAEMSGWRGKASKDPAAWMEANLDFSARLLEATLRLSGELPEAYFQRAENISKSGLALLDHLRAVAAAKAPAGEWAALASKLEDACRELEESIPRVKD